MGNTATGPSGYGVLRGEGPHLLDVSVGARFKVEGTGVHVSWIGLVSMEKGESVIHSLQACGQHYRKRGRVQLC